VPSTVKIGSAIELGQNDLVCQFYQYSPIWSHPYRSPSAKFSARWWTDGDSKADFIDIAVLGANPYPRQPSLKFSYL